MLDCAIIKLEYFEEAGLLSYQYKVTFSDADWCIYESNQPQQLISLATEVLQDEYAQITGNKLQKAQTLAINNQMAVIDAMKQVLTLEKELKQLKYENARYAEEIASLQTQITELETTDLDTKSAQVKQKLQQARANKSASELKHHTEQLNKLTKQKIKRKKK